MTNSELSPVKRALLEQRRLKARIEQLERARNLPIAVIGVGCRFPGGGNGPAAFWRLLRDGVDAISEMPPSRWEVASCYDPDPEAPGKIATRFGGFLEGIDQFDAHAFGISPREAETMDPQQRLLLEVAWEALQHAGCAVDRMAGSRTGVFVGIGPNDYVQEYALRGARADIDAYLATGNAHSVASGRISYLLGLHGPSISVDTACSSSLVAIFLACESIRSGSCDAALAGGVGILLGQQNYISLSKGRMMAADGRCKAFDARADGFVRSEGAGVVVLKPLAEAQRDGDRILAVIRGTACNQDGRSNGITAPNGPAQQAVIRAALANAGVTPSAVSYVEAHGTGTVLGDPIEVESLAAVLGEGRDASSPLLLGSVKTNIGHTEAAAGVAGFIKTVLALHHREIPPNLHFRTPNPHIQWDSCPYLRVPTTRTPWSAQGGPRIAGVSAFGFSGTNVHLVLEEAPESTCARASSDRPLHVLALSAKTDAALRVAAVELAGHLDASGAELADVCFSVNTSRAALPHRAFIVARNVQEMRSRLDDVAAGRPDANVRRGVAAEGAAPRVVFSFPAEGPADLGVARTLCATQPAFREAIAECDALLRADGKPGVLDASDAPHGPTVVFGVQYALAAVWRRWGVAPDAVLGDGVGNYAAATLAGVLKLEDALRFARGGTLAADAVAAPQVPIFSSATGRRSTLAEFTGMLQGTSDPAGRPQSAQRVAALAAAAREGFSEVLEIRPLEWGPLTSSLGDLFVRGGTIDWRGFDRDHGRSRVDVPPAPSMRQRYWFQEKAPSSTQAADVVSAWDAVNLAAGRQAEFVPVDVELSRYRELWTDLDALTTRAVARTIGEVGLFQSPGESHTIETAMAKGHVLPVYGHLLSLWMQRLARAGILARRGDAFVAVEPSGSIAHAGEASSAAGDASSILRDYLTRCDRQLAAIVTGRQAAIETLFPGGSFETADFFYREWGLARYYNGILRSAATTLLGRAGGRPQHVLEIGAGTGGTTAALVPIAAAAGTVTEYWFTDVSEHFFDRAEREYADHAFMRFRKYDLDEDPLAQGLPAGHFDLVVAANALHATKDLARAIDGARSLLAPNGVLMLYEVTTHLDWFEMSIALVEGWQHHKDDLRDETPLLTPALWERALRERGFDRVSVYPRSGSPATILGHHVILASASAEAAASATATPPPLAEVAPTPAQRGRRSDPEVAVADAPPVALRDRLAGLTHGEQTEIVERIVQRLVMRVMRLGRGAPAPGTGDRLMSIGMDSLMAIELKKLLLKEVNGSIQLPSTLIFDHPTIAAIAALVLSSLGFGAETALPEADVQESTPGQSAAEAVADLTDEEVAALLADRLKGIAQ